MPPSKRRAPRTAKIAPQTHAALEALYTQYNRAAFIDPDPLAPVLRYAAPEDREVAGLIAAALAFGGVKQILRSLEIVLEALPAPHADLMNTPPRTLQRRLATFRHRYVTGAEVCDLLAGARRVIAAHGSLGECFARAIAPEDETVVPALTRFVAALRADAALPKNYLLPEPSRGSACKRWFMYLRWMVRHDAVDPGGWGGVPASKLVYPLDTHMHRTALRLGLTRRTTADLRAALEVTAAFRRIAPEDPVRYDFCLTRLGIRSDTDAEVFFRTCGLK